MPDIHTIRLREPWKSELRGGQTVWTRNFNWPAGLTAREVVWLVIENLPASTGVEVNSQQLIADSPGKFNITKLIAESNRIAIATPTAACPFDVRLEIDEG